MDPLLQALDWSPLAQTNLNDEAKKQLLSSVMPLIQVELKEKILAEFSQTDIDRVNQKAEKEKIKPEDGILMLEEEYFKKTGRYFMEELRLLANDYIKNLASVLAAAKKDVDALKNLPKDQLDYLHQLISEEKLDEAVKLFETLKS